MATLNDLGTSRVDENFSILMKIKLFSAMVGNNMPMYRTILQGQSL